METEVTALRRTIEKLIEHLEHVRVSPHLYAGKQACGDLPAIWIYLDGFKHACQLLGIDLSNEWRVFEERGWGNTTLPNKKMRDKGLDDKAISDEILLILIESLKRTYDILPSQ